MPPLSRRDEFQVTQGLVGNIINFGGAKSSTSYEVRVDIEEDEDDIEGKRVQCSFAVTDGHPAIMIDQHHDRPVKRAGTIEHIIKRNEALTIADRETESDDEVTNCISMTTPGEAAMDDEFVGMHAKTSRTRHRYDGIMCRCHSSSWPGESSLRKSEQPRLCHINETEPLPSYSVQLHCDHFQASGNGGTFCSISSICQQPSGLNRPLIMSQMSAQTLYCFPGFIARCYVHYHKI